MSRGGGGDRVYKGAVIEPQRKPERIYVGKKKKFDSRLYKLNMQLSLICYKFI